MQRFFFSIWQFFRHYAALKKVYQHAEAHVACVTDITVKFLQAVQVLVLDFDGVLAPHGASEPLPEVQRWLTSLMRGKTVNVFILSNKPNAQRAQWFAQHYPDITFISGVRKKPYPDGLHKIADITQVPLHEILLVDDRLATGVLATKIAGCQSLLVTSPYRDKHAHPFKERFFDFLRIVEQWLVH